MRALLALSAVLVTTLVLTGCEDVGEPSPDAPTVDSLEVSGTILYRERVALPEGSTANVVVRPAGAEDEVLGETTYTTSTQVPLPFRIAVSPADIDTLATYELTATLNAAGNSMRWDTPEPVSVLQNGTSTTDLEIILFAAEPGPEEISDEPWRLARERGVGFRAIGQEPGWVADIHGSRDDPERVELQVYYGEMERTFEQVTLDTDGDGHPLYRGADDEGEFSITIEDRICQDIMSGERFEAVVVLRLDEETFTGCGRSLR